MPRSRSGPGNESHQNKTGGLTLNLFLQFCVLFQVNIILKKIFKMNFCQSDIPGASLNRRLPAYETYRPRFDATREALYIACIRFLK